MATGANGSMSAKSKTLWLICSTHGPQKLSAFTFGGIVIKCGCTWRDINNKGLTYNGRLAYKHRFWEHSPEKRIKYSKCARSNCKNKVVGTYHQDFWCAKDLKRVKANS
jgi:hypothetical protein